MGKKFGNKLRGKTGPKIMQREATHGGSADAGNHQEPSTEGRGPGRPPKPDDEKLEQLAARLTPAVASKVRAAADELGLPHAVVIRRAVEAYVKQLEDARGEPLPTDHMPTGPRQIADVDPLARMRELRNRQGR